jgi:phenylacetate-CoA ligase
VPDPALREQLDYLEASSAFYRARIEGARDLEGIPFLTKADIRASQLARPPFGEHLCAPIEALVRLHVTSGTTGDPVAIGLTRADHEANSAVGGAAFRIAGVRDDDVIAHCLNYALYAGGIADHMALEASGATVVPVGVGQSLRLLDLVPRLGITAIYGTLSFPAHLAGRARDAGLDPAALGLRHIVTAGEPGAGLGAVRDQIEATWAASVADSFGMSDVWSTMAGECSAREGLHLTTEGHAVLELLEPETETTLPMADGAYGELVWTHLRREASPLLRYRSGDLARIWTSPCACGLTSPRIRIEGRVDDMLRVQAVNVHPGAIGAVLGRFDGLGRYAVVAEGDPIVPPLRVVVEAPNGVEGVADALRTELGARFEVQPVAPGALPVGEQKTRVVYRTARGEELPHPLSQPENDSQSAEGGAPWA